jgi:hypothetical protein
VEAALSPVRGLTRASVQQQAKGNMHNAIEMTD